MPYARTLRGEATSAISSLNGFSQFAPSRLGLAMEEFVLRLLVPASIPAPAGRASVELLGRRWVLSDSVESSNPPYTCVSYAWGRGRAASPLDALQMISDRALPAAEATLRARAPTAIWIDALCVPAEEPARTACVRSLGAVYSRAAEVAVVLSPPCAPILHQIQREHRVNEETLAVLENDEWVTRAWTYQEVVNSRALQFIAEGVSDVAIPGSDLLSCVGEAIQHFKSARGYGAYDMHEQHPRLSDLEDLIADWMTAAYLERSAYRAMSSMHRRVGERPEDYFLAMVGTVSTKPVEDEDLGPNDPAEYFMKVCEEKGDFSFIYSSASRSNVPGRCWRPRAGDLRAVLPWHSWGPGQAGQLEPSHVRLDGLCRFVPGPLTPEAAAFLDAWLRSDGGSAPPTPSALVSAVAQDLRRAGFTGCGEPIELPQGYFFPQWPPEPAESLVALVATGVKWVHGAPGLLVRESSSGIHHCRGVGAFVGRVPDAGESFDIGAF